MFSAKLSECSLHEDFLWRLNVLIRKLNLIGLICYILLKISPSKSKINLREISFLKQSQVRLTVTGLFGLSLEFDNICVSKTLKSK